MLWAVSHPLNRCRRFRGFFITAVLALVVCVPVSRGQNIGSNAVRVPVYVNDFELFSLLPDPAANPHGSIPPRNVANSRFPNNTKAAKDIKDAPPSVIQDSDPPSAQARRLMDFFSDTLVQAFQKQGFQAARLFGARPDKGVLLRGVFAEPDASNRIRRSLWGAISPNAQFILYVGTFNLARLDQPLYQPAPVQAADVRFGPVITLNSYIPLVKYSLPKNPSEDDVRKICTQIVSGLASLLNANPDAFSK